MSIELDKILGTDDKTVTLPDPAKEPENKDVKKDPEILSKEQALANINKAISDASETLRLKRKEIKDGTSAPADADEPKIDLNDPNSKAWDKHIRETVDPVTNEIEAEKQEIFKFAFQDFISKRPALAGNSEKMKQIIATYDRIKNNTGRVREGILHDLSRAYAAENFETIEDERHAGRVANARRAAIDADPGVSRGVSGYMQQRDPEPEYDDQDAAILAKWGMSPQEHAALKKEQDAKREA